MSEATIFRLVAFVVAALLIFFGHNVFEVVVGVAIMVGVVVSLEESKDDDDEDDTE